MCRSAGTYAKLTNKEGDYATLVLPRGEVRACRSTAAPPSARSATRPPPAPLGKAGMTRLMGRRPITRGMAKSHHAHPLGGGSGRSKGNRPPCGPTGVLAKGGRTRNPQEAVEQADHPPRVSKRYGQKSCTGTPMGRSLKKGPFVVEKLYPQGREAEPSRRKRAHQDLGPPLHHRPRVRRAHLQGAQRRPSSTSSSPRTWSATSSASSATRTFRGHTNKKEGIEGGESSGAAAPALRTEEVRTCRETQRRQLKKLAEPRGVSASSSARRSAAPGSRATRRLAVKNWMAGATTRAARPSTSQARRRRLRRPKDIARFTSQVRTTAAARARPSCSWTWSAARPSTRP
jgi:hypothetical protein